MSIEAVNQFMQKVSEDVSLESELTQALNSENNLQSATDLGAKHGYMFNSDELSTEIQKYLSDGELLEEELEAIAGGGLGTLLARGIHVIKRGLQGKKPIPRSKRHKGPRWPID